ncbi:MAG: hypothetical protein DI529_06490 [Chryseobacterium sp.]|nr:MAG: hypothetical protein DI529_06490 [Chryseobacterium sp.]
MNWKTIFNPFGKFDEKHILVLGIIFFIINIFICEYSGMVNDSIFHLSFINENQTIWDILKINSLSYAFAIIVLFILAKSFNNKTRIIDIINTILISAIPLAIVPLITGLPFLKDATQSIAKSAGDPSQVDMANLILVTVFGLATLPLMIYSFVLLYNGFQTATNIKKWQQIVLFVIVVFVQIIVSQTIL